MVVDYRPQKPDPNRVTMTAGGNLIKYPGKLTTITADLTTSKINKLLNKRLAPAGYYEVPHTPGLWKHLSRPIAFTLVVDDFGEKYAGKKNSYHLIAALKVKYKISEDCTGSLYCGIDLDWNYIARTLEFVMPGYINTQLQRNEHSKPTHPQHSPHPVASRRYGKSAQDPIPPDETPTAGPDRILQVQQVLGGII